MRQHLDKLLFVSDAPHFGGAERYVASMAACAQRSGISASVCWLRPVNCGSDVFALLQRDGIPLLTVPADEVRSLRTLSMRLRDIYMTQKPSAVIINACGRPRLWVASWMAKLQSIPAAWVHHMVDQQDYRRLPASWLGARVEGPHLWRLPQSIRHRLAAAGATTIITLNEQDRRHVARDHCLRPERIAVVPNGIDLTAYRFDPTARERVRAAWRVEDKAFTIGTAGRLVAGKGIEEILRAAVLLRDHGVPVRVIVAGDGPARSECEKTAMAAGLQDCVVFLGQVEDMPAFYSGLDVFVLASRSESFGLVLAEAMACERAVVATPTAGARLQVEHDRCGVLCEDYSASALADALHALYRDPARCEQLGMNGRQRVSRMFSVDVALQRTLALLGGRTSKETACCEPAWAAGGAA